MPYLKAQPRSASVECVFPCACVCVSVLQILFFELHLPPNGDVGGVINKKTLGYTRRGGKVRLGKQFSTTKVQDMSKRVHLVPPLIVRLSVWPAECVMIWDVFHYVVRTCWRSFDRSTCCPG